MWCWKVEIQRGSEIAKANDVSWHCLMCLQSSRSSQLLGAPLYPYFSRGATPDLKIIEFRCQTFNKSNGVKQVEPRNTQGHSYSAFATEIEVSPQRWGNFSQRLGCGDMFTGARLWSAHGSGLVKIQVSMRHHKPISAVAGILQPEFAVCRGTRLAKKSFFSFFIFVSIVHWPLKFQAMSRFLLPVRVKLETSATVGATTASPCHGRAMSQWNMNKPK